MDVVPMRPFEDLAALVGGPLAPPFGVAIAAEWGERSGGGRGRLATSHVNTGVVYYDNISLGAALWSEVVRRVRDGARAGSYSFGALRDHWPGDQGGLSLLLRSDKRASAAVKVLPFGCPFGTPWGDAIAHLPTGPVCPGPSCVSSWDPPRHRTPWMLAARDCVVRQLSRPAAEGRTSGRCGV